MGYEAPSEPQYRLVSSLDPIAANRRDVSGLLEPGVADHKLFDAKSAGAGSARSDLLYHAILDRGRLVGFWEYDFDARSIVWMTFRPESDALKSAVAETDAFVRDQVGDARAVSLDSPKSRAPRIQALKNA